MGYILPPPPADNEVIQDLGDGQVYTWGEHRQMEASLRDLEATDPVVAAARAKLYERLEKAGFTVGPGIEVIRICEWCKVTEYKRHAVMCPDYIKDLPVTRDAGGYEFLDENFQVMYYTSVCATDEEAYDYFRIIEVMFATPPHVRFVRRRELHKAEYNILPVQYNWENKTVSEIKL